MAKDKDVNLDQVVRSIERVYPSTAVMIWRSFLHGLFTALGATIGLAIIVSILAYLVSKAEFIPKDYRQGIERVLPEE